MALLILICVSFKVLIPHLVFCHSLRCRSLSMASRSQQDLLHLKIDTLMDLVISCQKLEAS